MNRKSWNRGLLVIDRKDLIQKVTINKISGQ